MANIDSLKTLPGIDLKATVVNGLKFGCQMIRQDLEALPEEAFNKGFGGTSRTVADFIYEVTLVNDHVGMVVRGEDAFDWPEGGWIMAPENFRTKEQVLGGFNKSSDTILATAENMSIEQLEGNSRDTWRANVFPTVPIHHPACGITVDN